MRWSSCKKEINEKRGEGMILQRKSCIFHVIDPQEKLMRHITDGDRVLENIGLLIQAAEILGVPVVANTQYRKGLGEYPASLANIMASTEPIDKVEFNCLASKDTSEYYTSLLPGIEHAVLMGVESHICIYQTACGLLDRDITPWVVSNGVGARNLSDHQVAIRRLENIGCPVVSAEMVVYMLLEKAGTAEFKKILPLITQ